MLLECHSDEGWGPVSSRYSALAPCFIDGSLTGSLALFLLVFGGGQLIRLFNRPSNRINYPAIFYVRLTALVLVAIVQWIEMLRRNATSAPNTKDVITSSQFLLSLTIVLIAAPLQYIEYSRQLVPAGSLLFFYLLAACLQLLRFASVLVKRSEQDFTNDLSFTIVLFSLYAFLLLANLLARKKWPSRITLALDQSLLPQSPIEYADIFSRLTFSWVTPLMIAGYKSFLTEEDLSPLPKDDVAETASSKFNKYWQKELHRSNPSLFLALSRAFSSPFLIAAIYKMLQDILSFTQPQLLKYLIIFIQKRSNSDEVPMIDGYMIAIAMLIVSVTQTAFLHQYFHLVFKCGMNIKSALTATIYKKSLALSNQSRSKQNTGDIVNLMSVDTQRLQDLTQYGQIIWSGPFQITLCLYSLHNLVGNAMWPGVAIMVIMIPINSLIARVQKNLQKEQMKTKDARTRITNEILTNMKSIKLYAWEDSFLGRLLDIRNNQELKNLKKMGTWSALTLFIWSSIPFIVSCATFAAFVYTSDVPLTTDIVFPALTLFNLLSFPLAVFPNVLTSAIEAAVSLKRLKNFLTAEELQADAVLRLPRETEMDKPAVIIKNGVFLWEVEPTYSVVLSDINFTACKGQLSCIIGRVGAGKSSLLQACLGSLHKADGTVTVKGCISYAAQVPWIMNGSIKENILFGKKYDPNFYNSTLEACCLTEDLLILPDGDETEVGEKGISLSGGQKARLSLARAVYARSDVYLLDDVLSAVDQEVGNKLIDKVLGPNGLLASKTRILATNSIKVLKYADSISILRNGRIVESGSYAEAMANPESDIRALVTDYSFTHEQIRNSGSVTPNESSTETERLTGTEDESVHVYPSTAASAISTRRNSLTSLRRASTSSFGKPVPTNGNAKGNKRTQQAQEVSQKGKVKWSVYIEYAKACGSSGVIIYMILLTLAMSFNVLSNVWLKHWSEVNSGSGYNPDVTRFLLVYLLLGLGGSASTFTQSLILCILITVRSATILHNNLAKGVLRAPMSFFETTPVGRILNRFSSDVYRVDEVLARTFNAFFSNSFKVLFTLGVISAATPAFLFFVVPLGALYIYYQRYYLQTSRELKRLESVSRSPIFAHFQESLGGISTIKAYDQEKRFAHTNEARVDRNLMAYFPSVSANRWLAVRLEFLGSAIIFLTALLSVASISRGYVSAGLVGLSLSYALQITQSLNWIVRMTVDVETNIVSVERILEYSNITPEAPAIIPDHRPPKGWPETGEIEFSHYSTRYREGLDPVLKDISLSIKSQEKIGIVGRTGAGKSSLTLALFRIIEPIQGHISIDALNTSTIGLKDLRTKLSIIPQDSQAFEGTIRENLDPFGRHDDAKLWQALELSHLKQYIQEKYPDGLDGPVAEGGSNFSVGQRQLLSLARALLTPSTVLVLDEATAAVDVETDHVIQQTIRTQFANRTILTIAHRLNTIMDSDRILVLGEGRVLEFDSPDVLLSDTNSAFYKLLHGNQENL
ncbi:hypothetical protein CANCADRAFT_30952 [Tortispora caseinolytica NRRL Y-17796]|uniref:Metal resistance protein YCF1 n=1 Tax=Tortispora caseinolytica NRRL Y-17796 TaxID=767744 RepID=A0A1E4TMK0_9ASCO|nr:hypothetical protein CANCADRAFT_30952 [Tortispora caseinolytica NRRL Y-17796]